MMGVFGRVELWVSIKGVDLIDRLIDCRLLGNTVIDKWLLMFKAQQAKTDGPRNFYGKES
jgi:hypothetical protein